MGSVLAARPDANSPDRIINEHAKVEFSNGAQRFVAELVRIAGDASLTLVFENGFPEPEQEFWISAASEQVEPTEIGHVEDSKVVVFPAALSGVRAAPVDLARFAGFAAE